MEIREGGFANSVASVAQELMGPEFQTDKQNYPSHVKHYLPLLRDGLREANQSKGKGGSYAHIALNGVITSKNNREAYASDGVPWTVAVAILTKDKALAETNEGDLRFLFDLSLEIAVNHYHERSGGASQSAVYEKSPQSQIKFKAAADEFRKITEYYKSLQAKLREPISVSPVLQRK